MCIRDSTKGETSTQGAELEQEGAPDGSRLQFFSTLTGEPDYGGGETTPGPDFHQDINGGRTNRTGPGSGGNHALSGGITDSRRTNSATTGNSLGTQNDGSRAYQHHHPIQITGTGQNSSGSLSTANFDSGDSQSATLEWDNQPEWVSLVFIMKV